MQLSQLKLIVVGLPLLFLNSIASAQMGGGGGQPGAGVPGVAKPKFSERVLQEGGPRVKETDGRLVADVKIEGLRVVPEDRVFNKLQTRADRNFSRETVMEDVRRLYGMEYFSSVTHRLEERPEGVVVTYVVQERDLISEVIFFGNRGMDERELKGHAGLRPGDPLNEQSIESAKRRLIEFYHEDGFLDAVVEVKIGLPNSPRAVVFRINEGPKMRVDSVRVTGSKFVEEARLKKIVTARGGWLGVPRYFGNTASKSLFEDDVERLKLYYRNLGFFEATAGYRIHIDPSGKWIDVEYVINEGPRYQVVDAQIMGSKYITEESLRQRLRLLPGEPFDRGKMDADVRTIRDAYGEQGFFFADVQAQPTLLDDPAKLAMVYRITEGDRCKCGEIRVHIEGDSLHTRVAPIFNRMDGVRPGQILNRQKVEQSERRLGASGLFETNPAEGEKPRIEVATPSLTEPLY